MSNNTGDGPVVTVFKAIAVVGLAACTFLTVVLFLFGTDSVLRVMGMEVDRRVVESSRQCAETNTSAFYTKLEAINKINVQLAGLDPLDPLVPALESQRELLSNEARREVAKIPYDAHTPDMYPFESGSR